VSSAPPLVIIGSLLALAAPVARAGEPSWDEQIETGVTLSRDGRLDEAEAAFRAALETAEASGLSGRLVRSLMSLAEILDAGKKWDESAGLYRRALALAEARPDVAGDDLYTAKILQRLASACKETGDDAEAERSFARALPVVEKAMGAEHPVAIAIVKDLARVSERLGKHDAAEQNYRRALAAAERSLGNNHPKVLPPLTRLARFFHDRGRLAEAEALYLRAIRIREGVSGPEHPEIGALLAAYADILEKADRPDAAKETRARATAIMRGHLDRLREEVERILGKEDAERVDLVEALAKQRERLTLLEPALGADHASVTTARHRLATIHMRLGDYAKAEDSLRSALADAEKDGDPSVAGLLVDLADVLCMRGMFEDAEEVCVRARDALGSAEGDARVELVRALGLLGRIRSDRGLYDKAAEALKSALEIEEELSGPKSAEVASRLSEIAAVEMQAGRHGAAEDLLERARGIFEELEGDSGASVASTLL